MKLYAYVLPNDATKAGLLKIGQAADADKRIKEQIGATRMEYAKVLDEPAVAGKRNVSDYDVHRLLAERGFERIDGEWFRCTADDVRDALDFLKQKYRNEDKRKDLEQKFYEELRNWYFWATEESKNPDYTLRIIIRLLLCFFLREKGLIPACLFEREFIEENLKENEYRYYNVVIRNLFFYSLNTPQEQRGELENKTLIRNYGKVREQFHKNIPFLNGGLFTEHPGDDTPLDNGYFFSEPLPRTIKELGGKYSVAGIVTILSQYKYTLDETDSSEFIDPEFIGKMFESLLACIEADSKESRQKITGSYYTPREIVDYMVNESLDAYLREPPTASARDLNKCKILDPACGSGAFPCSIMNAMMLRLDPNKTLSLRERYQKKLAILQNVIYGVDIQPMAVQITMLRLFLSLIQEIQPDKSKRNFGIESLPNLDYKFAAADTLCKIEVEGLFFHSFKAAFAEIIELKRDYFCETAHIKRERLRERIYQLEQDLAERSDNGGIKALCEWNHSETAASAYFDSRWVFGVEEFDIVIGNPPYGAGYPAEQKKYFQQHYESARTIKNKQKGSLDTFSLFIENAFHQVKKEGHVHFIVPLASISSDAMVGLHKLLLDNCSIIKVSSYGVRPAKIFASAGIRAAVLCFTKTGTKCKQLLTTQLNRLPERDKLGEILAGLQFTDSLKYRLEGRFAKISLPIEKRILKKLRTVKTNIGTLRQDAGKPIYYRTSGGGYYNVVTNKSMDSTKEKPLYFDRKYANTVGAVFSSSLFWWYQQVYSNNLDLKSYEIESFPIPVEKLTSAVVGKIEKVYAAYLRDIQKNVREHKTEAYKKVKSFKEFKIRYSKPLIDEIDDLIAPLYGLTDEERDFIKNYEIKFRVDAAEDAH